MELTYFERHPRIKDMLNFFVFIVLVLVGTLIINQFIFRSFSVSGHSMDDTLHHGDRLIVNRLPVTAASFKNTDYVPERGQIIVFKNPRFVSGAPDEYIVKRVIAFPGERVVVRDGILTVFNSEYPNGHVYDDEYRHADAGPKSPASGDVDTTIPDGVLFVAGDNRLGNSSYDSRSGLGLIPFFDVIGPVGLRIFPFTSMNIF